MLAQRNNAAFAYQTATTKHLSALLPAAQAGVEHTVLIYNALNSAGERPSPDESMPPSLTGPP